MSTYLWLQNQALLLPQGDFFFFPRNLEPCLLKKMRTVKFDNKSNRQLGYYHSFWELPVLPMKWWGLTGWSQRFLTAPVCDIRTWVWAPLLGMKFIDWTPVSPEIEGSSSGMVQFHQTKKNFLLQMIVLLVFERKLNDLLSVQEAVLSVS